jgi:hypothetical protein
MIFHHGLLRLTQIKFKKLRHEFHEIKIRAIRVFNSLSFNSHIISSFAANNINIKWTYPIF